MSEGMQQYSVNTAAGHHVEMTGSHCRAARAWLRLSQKALTAPYVTNSERQLQQLERDRSTGQFDLIFRRDLEQRGIIFVEHGIMTEHPVPTAQPLSPVQSLAARAWFRWTQKELATRSGIPLSNIYFFETEQLQRWGRWENIHRGDAWPAMDLKKTFEDAGITFHFTADGRAVGFTHDRVRCSENH
jgi:hypothetical protein